MSAAPSIEPRLRDARAAVVLRYRPLIVRFLVRRCKSWDEAEDVFQDLLLSVLDSPLPRDPDERRRWLVGRARGLLHTRRRREESTRDAAGQVVLHLPWLDSLATAAVERGELDAVIPDPAAGPETLVADRALLQRVTEAMQRLAWRDRRLLLEVAEGATIKAVAERRGCSRHRVYRRLVRARARLCAALEPELVEEISRLLGARPAAR